MSMFILKNFFEVRNSVELHQTRTIEVNAVEKMSSVNPNYMAEQKLDGQVWKKSATLPKSSPGCFIVHVFLR